MCLLFLVGQGWPEKVLRAVDRTVYNLQGLRNVNLCMC